MKKIDILLLVMMLFTALVSCSDDECVSNQQKQEYTEKDSVDASHYTSLISLFAEEIWTEDASDPVYHTTFGSILSPNDTTQRFCVVESAEEAERRFVQLIDFATHDAEAIIDKDGVLIYDMGQYGQLVYHRAGRNNQELGYAEIEMYRLDDFNILSFQQKWENNGYFDDDEVVSSLIGKSLRLGKQYLYVEEKKETVNGQEKTIKDTTIWLCVRQYNLQEPQKKAALINISSTAELVKITILDYFDYYLHAASAETMLAFRDLAENEYYQEDLNRYLYPCYYNNRNQVCKGINALEVGSNVHRGTPDQKITLFGELKIKNELDRTKHKYERKPYISYLLFTGKSCEWKMELDLAYAKSSGRPLPSQFSYRDISGKDVTRMNRVMFEKTFGPEESTSVSLYDPQ